MYRKSLYYKQFSLLYDTIISRRKNYILQPTDRKSDSKMFHAVLLPTASSIFLYLPGGNQAAAKQNKNRFCSN